jgi:hypothetical protein
MREGLANKGFGRFWRKFRKLPKKNRRMMAQARFKNACADTQANLWKAVAPHSTPQTEFPRQAGAAFIENIRPGRVEDGRIPAPLYWTTPRPKIRRFTRVLRGAYLHAGA